MIHRTSKEKNYDELDLHSLTRRRWRSKACITNAKSLNVFKMFIVSEKEKKSLF